MINEFLDLKCAFPEAPMLSYLRNHHLRNLLVHSCFIPPLSNLPAFHSSQYLSKQGKGSILCLSMTKTNSITQSFTKVKHALLREANVMQVTQFMQQIIQNAR